MSDNNSGWGRGERKEEKEVVHAYALVQPGLADVGVDGKEQERKGHVPQEGGRKPLVQAPQPQPPHDAHRRFGAAGRLGVLHLQPDLHCSVCVCVLIRPPHSPPASHYPGWRAGGTDLRRVGHSDLAHPGAGSRQDLVCQRDSASVGRNRTGGGGGGRGVHSLFGPYFFGIKRAQRKAVVEGEGGTNWSWSRAARCSRSFSLTASLTAFSGATPHRHAPSPR
jgi:hypothetical protein